MEEQTEPKKPEIQQNLTPEYAALLFFHSFRHSQGIPALQTEIFKYVHLIRPAWRITSEDRPKIEEISTRKIDSFLGKQATTKHGVVAHRIISHSTEKVINVELEDMRDAFNGDYIVIPWIPGAKNRLVKQIAKYIITSDLDYCKRQYGRERNPSYSEKPLLDPWLSFVIHFGINKNSTNIAEFDQMYADIRKVILSGKVMNLKDRTQTKFAQLLEIYQQKHPNILINWKN